MIAAHDPRLTAYVLDEMSASERQAFEAELALSPDAERAVAELASAAALLHSEIAEGAPEALAGRERRRIDEAAVSAGTRRVGRSEAERPPAPSPVTTARARRRFARFAALGGALAVAAGVLSVGIVTTRRAEERPAGALAQSGDGSRAGGESRNARYRDPAGNDGGPALGFAGDGRFRTGEGEHGVGTVDEDVATGIELPLKAWPEPAEEPVDNPFVDPAADPKSTFSVDVDTASYALVRRALGAGTTPLASSVRIEELVNYFPYAYPEPEGAAFSVTADSAPAPWAPDHELVRIGLRGKTIELGARPPSNLVFLVDVSGSMNGPDRLELLKQSLALLVGELDERDSVAIVTYAGASGILLSPTRGNEQKKLLDAIAGLAAGGSTNGASGIRLAYETATKAFVRGGANRVILATDGDFNVGVTSRDELVKLIEEEAKTGVFLSVLGFGRGNFRDGTMEQLADRGNGNYAYIDRLAEGRRVLVEQASGTLLTIAKDVKIQLTFDPATVQSFRLIGYENRMLRTRDFADDRVDAGDIGAGHRVTALYEVVPKAKGEGAHYADIALRYKEPDGQTSRLIETAVHGSGVRFDDASSDFRFATAVAGFGMLLRRSPLGGQLAYEDVRAIAAGALGDDPRGERAEFVRLVDAAARLSH